jgi:hypothetical protein
LVPILPLRYEIPVLPTAPVVVNKTKSAALPRSGACAKFADGKYRKARRISVGMTFISIRSKVKRT